MSGTTVTDPSKLQARPWPRHSDRKIANAGDHLGIQDGVNVGYGDFHAKWRNVNQMWRSDNDWRRNPTPGR